MYIQQHKYYTIPVHYCILYYIVLYLKGFKTMIFEIYLKLYDNFLITLINLIFLGIQE